MANAVAGVTEGFKRELDIVGVGYRAELKGSQVIFALGYSHPVVFDVPLLTESSHWRARVQRVLVVDCSEDTQAARVAARERHGQLVAVGMPVAGQA